MRVGVHAILSIRLYLSVKATTSGNLGVFGDLRWVFITTILAHRYITYYRYPLQP